MSPDASTMVEHAADNLFSILTRGLTDRLDKKFLLLQGGGSVTFGQLLAEAARVTTWLARCGVRAGDRVVVQLDKSPAAVVLYLGCVRSGAVFVPLNTAYMASEVAYFLDDADPALVVAGETNAAATVPFAGRRELLGRELLGRELDAAPWRDLAPAEAVAAVGPHDPAAILYTSGTTGRSKGAVLTHRNLSSNMLVLHEAWRWQQGDVLLHALPIYHAHGLFVALHGALLNGSPILFHEKFDAAAVIADLPAATVFMGVPTFYARLLEDPQLDRSVCRSMRVFISGSAPLLDSTFAAFRARTGHEILERYGMTEAIMVTSNPYDGPRRPGTVGLALPGIDVRIRAENEHEVGPGEPGLLELKGPNLFSGYWRNPEKTAAEHTADGYFISGDVAARDTDGFISIIGRNKDLIISGGFNVYPKEVELVVDALPGVAESAVVGVPHPDFGEGVVAVVVAQPGAILDPARIRAETALSLAAFKRPKAVIVVDELPRNALGKVQKAALRAEHAHLFAHAEPRSSKVR